MRTVLGVLNKTV